MIHAAKIVEDLRIPLGNRLERLVGALRTADRSPSADGSGRRNRTPADRVGGDVAMAFRGSVASLVVDERREWASFLRTLSEAQWDRPSLCDGWTVRDVVAHAVSYEEATPLAVASRFVRGGLRLSGANAVGLRDRGFVPASALIDELERNLHPRGLTRMFGSRIALLDAVVHNQDIRRALGFPRLIPAERLVPCLNFARVAPPIAAYPRIRGLRMTATDLDWSAGRGPLVNGPAETLLMAIAGRRTSYDDLAGPGAAILLSRIG